MLNRANSKIGKHYQSCVYAVIDIDDRYSKLLEYGDPSSKTFSRRLARETSSDYLEKTEDPKTGDLACFFDKRGIFGHVGIYIEGYIYHLVENISEGRLISVKSDIILDNMLYERIEYFKIKEVINDNS